MKHIYALIVLVLFVSGCSSIKSKREHNDKNNPDNVDMTVDGLPGEKVDVKPQEETVRVGDRGGDVYSNTETSEQPHGDIRKPRIGLNLGPGIYRTINYVSLLKILERQNLSPDIITGTDFGAIIAAMYASGMTPEVIEWNFYKYLREKRKSKPYDADWVADIDKSLLSKFKNLNVQDTKKKLFITLYDSTTKKTYYFDKGNIRDLLLLNLRLTTNPAQAKSGQKYSSAIENEVYNSKLLKQLGAEFTIAADVLGTKFDFDNANEFLFGLFGKTAGRIQKQKKDFDYIVTLPLNTMNLDSTKDGPLYLQKSYEFMQKQAPLIAKKLQVKLDSGNE
jgi:hypothetical protein